MPKSSLPVSRVSEETIVEKIYVIGEKKIMPDRDLAELYGVEVSALNQAFKRNKIRFPEDFMFQINPNEFQNLKSQFVISSWGCARTLPYVFTGQGMAMVSSVLNSETGIQVIPIPIGTEKEDLWMKIEKIKQHLIKNDGIKTIFAFLNKLLIPEDKPRNPIGFKRVKINKDDRN